MAAVNHLLLEIVPTVGHLHPQAIDQSRGAAGQLFARCMQRQHARLAMKVRTSALAISPPLLGMTLAIWRLSGLKWPTMWAAILSRPPGSWTRLALPSIADQLPCRHHATGSLHHRAAQHSNFPALSMSASAWRPA